MNNQIFVAFLISEIEVTNTRTVIAQMYPNGNMFEVHEHECKYKSKISTIEEAGSLYNHITKDKENLLNKLITNCYLNLLYFKDEDALEKQELHLDRNDTACMEVVEVIVDNKTTGCASYKRIKFYKNFKIEFKLTVKSIDELSAMINMFTDLINELRKDSKFSKQIEGITEFVIYNKSNMLKLDFIELVNHMYLFLNKLQNDNFNKQHSN